MRVTPDDGMDTGKVNTYSLLVRMKTIRATVEISVEFPQKARNRFIIWSSYATLGHIIKGY